MSIYHLRDLLSSVRTLIKSADVKYINVPAYEHLSTDDCLEWARNYNNGEAMLGLPLTQKEIDHLPKAYICNVIFTLAGQPFQSWVDQQIELRNAKIIDDKDLSINIDSELEALFRQSTSVSRKFERSIFAVNS